MRTSTRSWSRRANASRPASRPPAPRTRIPETARSGGSSVHPRERGRDHVTAIMEKRSTDGANLEAQQSLRVLAAEPNPPRHAAPGNSAPSLRRSRTWRPTRRRSLQPGVCDRGGRLPDASTGPPCRMGDAVWPVLTTRPTVGGPHSDDDRRRGDDRGLRPRTCSRPRTDPSEFHRIKPHRRDAVPRDGPEPTHGAQHAGLKKSSTPRSIAGASGLLTGANLANQQRRRR